MTSGPMAPVHHFESIASTNDEGLRLLAAGAAHGTAVTADFQTAGRGQPGRRWWMPPGEGILMSIILRNLPEGVEFGDLTLWLGGKIGAWLAEVSGARVDIKPPNDLLIGGRKVAGILCEARWRADELVGVVVGVGITVNVRDLPHELGGIATSLALATARTYHVSQLRSDLIAKIRIWISEN